MTTEENREYQRLWKKRYRREHKEEANAADRSYRKRRSPEQAARARESQRLYHQEHKSQIRESEKEVYRTSPSRRFRNRRTRYGITQEEYDTKLKSQDGKCAVCFSPMTVPHVDHNHVTEKVRDLLCVNCNAVLGHAHEKISVLESAISYLKKHGVENG